jgi:hypothetical protein
MCPGPMYKSIWLSCTAVLLIYRALLVAGSSVALSKGLPQGHALPLQPAIPVSWWIGWGQPASEGGVAKLWIRLYVDASDVSRQQVCLGTICA